MCSYKIFINLNSFHKPSTWHTKLIFVVGLALVGKDIVFRFIIEYSSLRDFGPFVIIIIIIGLFIFI